MEICFSLIAFLLSGVAMTSAEDQKLVFNLPLYCLASVYLVLQILASLFFMGLQGSCEPWCYAINVSLLAVYLCALLATRATLSHIVQVDKSAEQQTSFVNALMLELETMRDRTEGERKKKIEEVIDVARYSNLRSCDASQEIEEVILETAKNLSAVIQDEPNSSITDMTNRISEQLKRRDRICKK
ncbi:hypothetical protein [Adlercreutzia equolifaciens]|uniref:Uncharacterized protein n=1 Tax=Adlercreutzia equolifaciens TaxID=446660 RepID=A0A6L8Q738_9ACTN|nr:hypothetical protein [Adlercreutzia equolifaciens]MZG29123.1 hypothetical protein [Adlercreutzia equolifaciens]